MHIEKSEQFVLRSGELMLSFSRVENKKIVNLQLEKRQKPGKFFGIDRFNIDVTEEELSELYNSLGELIDAFKKMSSGESFFTDGMEPK